MIVRRCITLILLLLSSVPAISQPQDIIIISPRVGKTVDAEERSYFQLFPNQPQLGDIVFISGAQGMVAVYDGGQQIGTLDAGQLRLFRQYIAEYDSLRMEDRRRSISRAVNNRFEILWDTGVIDTFGHWEGETVQVLIRYGKTEAKAVKGELLWADANQVYLLPEGDGSTGTPKRIPAADIAAISTFSNNPGKGALIGGGVGAGIGLVLGLLATSAQYYDTGESVAVAAFLAVIFAVPAAVIGTIIGLMSSNEERHVIEQSYSYHTLLPDLQKRMYYRNGLPPDTPWREQ